MWHGDSNKNKQTNNPKKVSNPSHILDKIFVLILHIVTAVILLNKFEYLCVFLEDL